MQALGMSGLADRRFASLANSQQRLALLARALVKFPPLLVRDEPCQGLDDRQRQQFLTQVENLCAHTPLTLIYVSHREEEIPGGMTHRLQLSGGTVTYAGPQRT